MNISKKKISKNISLQTDISLKDSEAIVNKFIELIKFNSKKKTVKIHNFGTFKLTHKNSRIGRNPKTKEEYKISSRNVISFKASKILLRYINGNIDE